MSRSSTPGKNTAVEPPARLASVNATDRANVARFVGRLEVRVPLHWPWRFERATLEKRADHEMIGDDLGTHWPDIDENLSARRCLSGGPAKRPD